jgi:hypothetical protein
LKRCFIGRSFWNPWKPGQFWNKRTACRNLVRLLFGPIEMTVPGQTLLSTIRKLFWCIGQTLAGISSVAEILV